MNRSLMYPPDIHVVCKHVIVIQQLNILKKNRISAFWSTNAINCSKIFLNVLKKELKTVNINMVFPWAWLDRSIDRIGLIRSPHQHRIIGEVVIAQSPQPPGPSSQAYSTPPMANRWIPFCEELSPSTWRYSRYFQSAVIGPSFQANRLPNKWKEASWKRVRLYRLTLLHTLE